MGAILSEGGLAGVLYGVATFGSRDRNLTLGVGFGFSENGWADTPTFSLGGMTRGYPGKCIS